MSPVLLGLLLLTASLNPQTGDRGGSATELVAQAEHEISSGDYAAAIRHARQAAELFKSAGDRVNQARALNRVGQAALYTGEYGPAAAAFRLAADLSAAGGDKEGQAAQLANLGNVHFFVGRYSEAARAYDSVLALVNAAGTAEWTGRRRRIVAANQAALHQRLGRDREALGIYQSLEGAELPADEQAQLLVNKGVLYRRLGDPVKALALYDEARRLFAGAQHVDGELGAMKNRGIALALDLRQLDAAERVFSEVVTLAGRAHNQRELLHAHLYRGETRLRGGAPAPAHDDFVAALTIARELKTPEEEWKALFGLGRTEARPESAQAHLSASISVIERIRERIGVPSLRSDFFNDKAEVYDTLVGQRLGTASAADIFNLVERSHSRVWRDRLGLSQPVDLASVQRALPDGALLLDYWSSARGAALVAATRTRAATLQVTVDAANLKAFLDRIASGDQADWRELSRALGADILPPSEWFEGIEHVLVVAPGMLALLPFELLSTTRGLLIEGATVSYTPTAATLVKSAPRATAWAPPWRVQLRAFGDPTASDDGAEGAVPISRLSSSAIEVRAVASELAGREELHLGQDNQKTYLLRPADAPILHIASHAAADSVAVERSRIMFSPAAPGEHVADYLYLREVYDLPLTNVELAVLSGCDTERGPLVRGEGVQSFSRAFLAAGARSTVTTLWRVADAPAASFMEVFYHHLQRGESRAGALRLAKLKFLESHSRLAHPHYWGAFILTGEGLRPIPRALDWNALMAGGAILLLLVSTGGWWILRWRSTATGATPPA